MIVMRRISLFLIITIVSLASLVAAIAAAYFVLEASSQSSSNWMGQMMSGMGNMVGGTGGTQIQNSAAGYFGVAFVVLISVAVVGVGGLIYFFAFPEIKTSRALNQSLMANSETSVSEAAPEKVVTPFESVLKTLTKDERKVVEVLTSHNGRYLQKYIRSDAGLSRLQTHRIVARLAERGIVTLEKTGNTNMVVLANWLK